jgi:glycosyltransferase involved in cell wall biosynthesis
MSVLNQTYKDFELIIVDDKSMDDSIKIIEKIEDNRIRLVKHQTNKGQNASLNTGIIESTNELIAFLDSDDIWFNSYLEKVHNKFLNDNSLGFVYALVENNQIWTLEGKNKYKEALSQCYISSMISICSRKSAIIEIGMFDTNFTNCQDDDFCIRLAKNNSFALINEALAKVYNDAGNRVTSNKTDYALGWEKLFKKHRRDIINFCGRKTLSKHYLKLSYYFLKSNTFFNSYKYLILSIFNYCISFKKNKIQEYTKKEYFNLIKLQLMKLLKETIKIVLLIK